MSSEDPNLRDIWSELTALRAELTGLRSELQGHQALMNERDLRYEVVNQGNKASVHAAEVASEKALLKNEEALREYKAGANEWRDTVKDLISDLRETDAAAGGRQQQNQWFVALAVGALSALPGVILLLIQLVQVLGKYTP